MKRFLISIFDFLICNWVRDLELETRELGDLAIGNGNQKKIKNQNQKKNLLGEADMRNDLLFALRSCGRVQGLQPVAVCRWRWVSARTRQFFNLRMRCVLKTLPVKAPQELAEVRITICGGARGSFSTRYNAVTNPIWEHSEIGRWDSQASPRGVQVRSTSRRRRNTPGQSSLVMAIFSM